MKINAHSFGLAGAITTSVWYGVIALLVKIWPYETLRFISAAHMIPRLENLMPYIKITPAGILTGITVHFIAAYCFFLVMALIYNMCSSLRSK